MSDNREIFYRQYERLGVALIRCMEQLKNDGSDGIGVYYRTVEEIEGLLQTCAFCENSETAIEEPLNLMQEAVGKQDTTALSNVLETQVYPLVISWLEGTQE